MSRSPLLARCLIVSIGVVVYANSLHGPLLFDDQSAILLNPQIRHVWPIVDALAPPQNSVLASRPVVNLSFAINYALAGNSVVGFHAGNVLLHILSALVLFGIVRLTLTSPTLRDRFAGMSEGMALASAAIWMVHPLLTEAVDYVSQRTELMMGLCYLLTLYCAIRAARSSTPDRFHAAAIAACLIGTGCKESMVTAPVIVMAYDRIFLFSSLRAALPSRRVLYAGLMLSWVELAALMSSRANTVGFHTGISAWTYLLNQAQVLARYFMLAIWPHALVLDYGVPRQLALGDVYPQLLLIGALIVLTAIALRRTPAAGFLGAWLFVTLAPTSSFIPIATEVGAERRMYLPLAALCVGAGIGGRLLIERFGRGAARPVAMAAACLAIAALSWGTVRRNQEYASAVTLLTTSVERRPQGRARFNLAVVLKAAGRRKDAIVQLRAAVVDNPQAQYVLGSELYDEGRFDEAIGELRAFLVRTPVRPSDAVAARNLLGLALAQEGRIDDAIRELEGALMLDPVNADLQGNLGFVLLKKGDFDAARQHYERSLESRPGNVFVLTNLGAALQGLGRTGDAAVQFRRALAIDPAYEEARQRLAALGREHAGH